VSSRDEAVRLLEDQHAAIASLLAELDEPAFVRRGTIGGGEWSAKDLAAHLGSWEEFAIATLEQVARGERPSIEDEFAGGNATDRLNEQEVQRFLDAPAPDVVARFEDVHRRIVRAIEATTDDEWAAAYAFDPEDRTLGERVGSLLGSEAGGFMHASAHLADLRAYVDSISR
jgi:uncharacterized protein (TIGR03083 family)